VTKLIHELSGQEKALPPSTKVNIELHRESDDFVLMVIPRNDTDTTKYKIAITNCCLYVPVGILSTPMYNEILSRWPNEPIVYHYRPLTVKSYGIPSQSEDFSSDALFPVII
jgi:hypothetical protein